MIKIDDSRVWLWTNRTIHGQKQKEKGKDDTIFSKVIYGRNCSSHDSIVHKAMVGKLVGNLPIPSS